jgi:hypothetical protein
VFASLNWIVGITYFRAAVLCLTGKYAADEQVPIRESGSKILGYFMPTDFAGATNEAIGLIDFPRSPNMNSTASSSLPIRCIRSMLEL